MVGKFLKFFGQLLKTSISNEYSLRLNFWIEVIFMAINNSFWVVTWLILFNKFGSVNGWGSEHIVLMMGITMATFGIYSFCFSGTADWLAGYIDRGELDTFILQPKNILLNVAASKCSPSAFGDFLSGLLFIGFSGLLSLSSLPIILLTLVAGCLVFLSMAIFVGTLAFWFKGVEGWGTQIFHLFLNLTMQPGSIYTGVVKTVLLFAVPAGIIAFLPIELVMNPTAWGLVKMVAIPLVFFAASVWFFYRGLRRYESGNNFGIRG
ncbi:MAG: ABC-2 family transporter protein [Dysgonamonadaceae bacterium]|jgi:ABC-2 type transport system permease protein|nr:ABC-2 family transporter protein [Dysgonamonadaceae bacterium]